MSELYTDTDAGLPVTRSDLPEKPTLQFVD